MELNEKKLKIISLLVDVNKIHILDLLEEILEQHNQEGDWWDELPKGEQEILDERVTEADTQEGIPSEEVMKEIYSEFKFMKNEL